MAYNLDNNVSAICALFSFPFYTLLEIYDIRDAKWVANLDNNVSAICAPFIFPFILYWRSMT